MASALANRYARALVDVVTKPGSSLTPESVVTELQSFFEALQSSIELRRVLLSPAVPAAKKRALITQLGARLNLSRPTQNFLFVVIDHRRLLLLDDMIAAVQGLLDERIGIIRGDVAAAQPVEPDQQSALSSRLGEKTGRQVRLRFSIDPGILGGVMVRIGSTIYDGSVRGRLQALQRRLATEN